MTEGWTVRVDRANDYEDTTLYDVLAPDTVQAERLVRTYAACTSRDKVRIVAPLTHTTIEAHALKEGEVKEWTLTTKVRLSRE